VPIARTVGELRALLDPPRRAGERIGFVPTMGALHEGHRSLVVRSAAECVVSCVSIFVNPLQFAVGEDFATYPRDLNRDVDLLAGTGADVVFAPDRAAFLPAERRTTVRVAGLGERLEGASRPGHFEGVTTIVALLLNAVAPDAAYFGEKDYQQLVMVRQMARDLGFPAEVVGCPVVREPDGLAMSSRNVYLSEVERRQAVELSAALFAAASDWQGDAGRAHSILTRRLGSAPGIHLDYAEVVDPETLAPLEGVVAGPAQALVAGRVGLTRLIDTIRLEPPQKGARHGNGS
jgi:pantoate--beta-alanine ligase